MRAVPGNLLKDVAVGSRVEWSHTLLPYIVTMQMYVGGFVCTHLRIRGGVGRLRIIRSNLPTRRRWCYVCVVRGTFS